MTIEILEVKEIEREDAPNTRAVSIAIDGFLLDVGGLPLTGNLQTILESDESRLLSIAAQKNKPVDVFNIKEKRVLKALALVIMDEINILRDLHSLSPRSANQIETAIRNKLKDQAGL